MRDEERAGERPERPRELLLGGGDDALCFTAGYRGAPFAAGVLHAWLAADRRPPKVVAGVSMGAVTAAAVERCYRELEAAEAQAREAQRWRWFRGYLDLLSDAPLKVIWQAIPDPVDFFARSPPAADLSCPPHLKGKEADARRRYFRLMKLGHWIGGLPIRLSTVARWGIAHVRAKEGVGGLPGLRSLHAWLLRRLLDLRLVLHLAFSPQWIPQWQVLHPPAPLRSALGRMLRRPLFGGRLWVMAMSFAAALLALAGATIAELGALLARAVPELSLGAAEGAARWLALFATFALAIGALVALESWLIGPLSRRRRSGTLVERLIAYAAHKVDIDRGLLSDYHVHRALHELFKDESGREPTIPDSRPGPSGEKPPHLLIVATPLQPLSTLDLSNQQVWARRGSLIEALRAALAVPGMFEPVRPEHAEDWLSPSDGNPLPPGLELDLVDASTVRKNPIPAFFKFVREHRDVGLALASRPRADGPGLHVVYGVPVDPRTAEEDAGGDERKDIVDQVRISLELAARRDTQLEQKQTEFLSELALIAQRSAGGDQDGLLAIFPQAIAPAAGVSFENPLEPERAEVLAQVAEGCRRSLERLYSKVLDRHFPDRAKVPCSRLLERVAPRRRPHISAETPGLPEVCRRCTKLLRHQRASSELDSERTYGLVDRRRRVDDHLELLPQLAREFPHLTGESPAVVFVASGGVFRGASHVGLIAALGAGGIRPDLVVGSSVGSLLGGALAAASTVAANLDRAEPSETADARADDDERHRVLALIADTFLRVDRRVALTRQLQNAIRQLGVRAACVDLSPDRLRKLIRRGSRDDPGFAASGAPPDLIDAISRLFVLPYSDTREIAAEFVAGHFARAGQRFFEAIKTETLRRLDIRYAVLGTSLLAPLARRLLSSDGAVDLDGSRQPFEVPAADGGRRIAYFCTASSLGRRQARLLGRDFPGRAGTFDLVTAALASGAFPALFSPRSEAEILPDVGRPGELFADGGMFDNLPFIPAIEVLADIQKAAVAAGESARSDSARSDSAALDFLRRRNSAPHLFIAGALDASPEAANDGERLDSFFSIRRRASRLRNNQKIRSFETTGRLIAKLVDRIVARPAHGEAAPLDTSEISGVVNAAVLAVEPVDADHLYPTYGFSATMGMSTEKAERAISHGCFRTFEALSLDRDPQRGEQLGRSLTALRESGRIPLIRMRERKQAEAVRREERGASGLRRCPFFTLEGKAFPCPFDAASRVGEEASRSGPFRNVVGIHHRCVTDDAHWPEGRAPRRGGS